MWTPQTPPPTIQVVVDRESWAFQLVLGLRPGCWWGWGAVSPAGLSPAGGASPFPGGSGQTHAPNLKEVARPPFPLLGGVFRVERTHLLPGPSASTLAPGRSGILEALELWS